MWAYYAGDYTGICLGYFLQESLSDVKPVLYKETRYRFFPTFADDEIDLVFKNNLLIKHIGWSSENEWRLVKKTDQKYIEFQDHEIACLIFGYRTDSNIVATIRRNIAKNIPIFYATPGARTLQINLLPYDYQENMNGSPPPMITSSEKLYDRLK